MTPTERDRKFSDLMREAQRGNALSYAELLRDLTPLLRGIIRKQRMLLDPQDVEDLLQDVLLSLHAVRVTYDPKRPFFPWLLAIVRNRLADGSRRYARRTENELQVDELPVTFVDPSANTDNGSYRDPELLKRALNELPRGQREAIEMLKLRQLSLKEASALTGASISSLKVSVHRGVSTLRKLLKKGVS